MPLKDPVARKAYQQGYFKQWRTTISPDKFLAGKKRYEDSKTAWVNEYKADKGCCVCGENDPACLDLHHKDPSQKEFAVGEHRRLCPGFQRLQEEMDKCEVLCANCHRKEHNRNKETYKELSRSVNSRPLVTLQFSIEFGE